MGELPLGLRIACYGIVVGIAWGVILFHSWMTPRLNRWLGTDVPIVTKEHRSLVFALALFFFAVMEYFNLLGTP